MLKNANVICESIFLLVKMPIIHMDVMIPRTYLWAFHPIFVTWFLVVFYDQVTKILRNSVLLFFAEQGKTGKNGSYQNENLET